MERKILAIIGGISQGSINQKLFRAMKNLAATAADTTVETFDISRLPFFSQDLEASPPTAVLDFRKTIKASDGVLFITPEYNRSFPGVLKNAIDWGSRPYGQNCWAKKPAAVIGASSGAIGTFGAQHHLRQVLAYLDMPTMGQPEFYLNASKSMNDKGEPVDENTKSFFQNFWHAFTAWVEQHRDHSK